MTSFSVAFVGVGGLFSCGIRDEFGPFVFASFSSIVTPASLPLPLCLFFWLCLVGLCASDRRSLKRTAVAIAGTHRGVGLLLDRRQSTSMVVSAPFIRWDIITYGSGGSARDGVYYLETAQGERVICAVAIPCEGNHMIYRPLDSFLEDYRSLLPSGPALEWNFRFQLGAWLDGIVYYSFLRYSRQGKMVLRAPFVRWAHIKNPSPASPRAALFYLQTAEGTRVSCALAIRGPTNRITYTALGAFLDEYRQILPLGAVTRWRFSSMFAQWLDGLLYHSFLLCSEEGVSNAWHLDYVASASSSQKLPNGLRACFPADGASTWIVLRHGFRAWPIEVINFEFHEGNVRLV